MTKLAYTLKEAAEAIGVSEPTMHAMVQQPGFPAFRVGKRWVIPMDAFSTWLNDRACEQAKL